jgi:3-mercaptopyruvate sulfurtransferase SseA
MDKGFTRVRPLEGGIDAWADAGYLTTNKLATDKLADNADDEAVVGVRHSEATLESPP